MVYFGTKNGVDYGMYLDSNDFIDNKYVELDDETHMDIINKANELQKNIVADENGYPILVDYPPPTEEELEQRELEELQSYLSSTDWYAIRYADSGEPIPQEIKQKRVDARVRISELRK